MSPLQDDPAARPFAIRASGTGTADSRAVDVRMQRPRVQLLGRRDLDDLAEVHHRDSVGDVADHGEVVGDEQVGEPELAPGAARAG